MSELDMSELEMSAGYPLPDYRRVSELTWNSLFSSLAGGKEGEREGEGCIPMSTRSSRGSSQEYQGVARSSREHEDSSNNKHSSNNE